MKKSSLLSTLSLNVHSTRNFYSYRKNTLAANEDIHVPDQIEEAIQSDRLEDSDVPQTPPDIGSPTTSYKQLNSFRNS